MPSPYLSKSDFKSCFDCRTKLYYRKKRYPTTLDDDPYMRFLADGGFMIETVAKAQFPGGVDITAERDADEAYAQTRRILDGAVDAVVFEAGVVWQKLHARIDIECAPQIRRYGYA